MPHTLQCPRCHGSVSIADDAAGQRVECPHCEKAFLAPGLTITPNDDDDWLKLDETPTPIKPAISNPGPSKPVATNSPKPASKEPQVNLEDFDDEFKIPEKKSYVAPGSKPPSKLNSADEALLAEFTSDLDDFTAEIDTPPPAAFPAAGQGTKFVAPAKPQVVKPGSNSPSPSPASPAPATPVPTHANEYRVLCNICGSVTYAKAAQAGKTIKCSDCHSPMVVPPPPKLRPKVDVNLDEAESVQFAQNPLSERRPDPFAKSAAALLEEASREEVASGPHKYEDEPDVKEWFKNVFGIFLDPGVVMHWIALSVLAAVPTFFILSSEAAILRLALIIGGIIFGGVVVSCGFAILQSVANQEESVSEWPVFDPFSWLGQLFVAVAAAAVAVVPVYMACSFVFGQNLISVAFSMFSVYALFPFVLLSMLDMNSPFVPFSAEVARSVTKCQESWGGFYFSSGLLFVCLFLLLAGLSSTPPPVAAAIGITAVIGIAFTYFSMIGRLAYAIGQAVNAPPMVNDIDRSRKSDAI